MNDRGARRVRAPFFPPEDHLSTYLVAEHRYFERCEEIQFPPFLGGVAGDGGLILRNSPRLGTFRFLL